MAQLGFNTSDAPPPNNDYAPIPAGEYPMRIVSSEMKDTNDGQGKYLKLEMDITDGPCAGRKHWENFNLVNKNQQAVEIAQRSLAQLCTAVGKLSVEDSEELHMLPFIGKMKVTPAKGQYGPGNQIGAYKAVDGAPAAPAPANGTSTGNAVGKPNATKSPEDGKYYDDNGGVVPPFRLSAYNKIG